MQIFRVLLNSSPRKLWGFVCRTSWFWAAFLLLFVLPGSREGALMAFNGPDNYFGYWGTTSLFHGYPTFSPDEWEGKRPSGVTDFDIQVLKMREANSEYVYLGQDTAGVSRTTSQNLLRRYPQETWLYALPLRDGMNSSGSIVQQINSLAQKKGHNAMALWRTYIVQGEKQEPSNAFYPVCLALIERRLGHYNSALQALERAGRCPLYDDHNLDFARAWLRAHEHVVTLSIEEKLYFWKQARSYEDGLIGSEAETISVENWGRQHTEMALALRWAGAMARVGDLMQRGTNSPDMWRIGALWKRRAWSLATSQKRWSVATAGQWAAFAKSHGRPDLAREATQHSKQFDLVKKYELAYVAGDRYDIGQSRDLVDRTENQVLGFGMLAVFVVMFHGIWVWMVWFVVGIFLWRAIGAPASTRERLLPAFVSAGLAIVAAVLLCWGIWQFSQLSWPLGAGREDVCVDLGMLLFFTIPFWCVPLCTWGVARRERATLDIPPRQAMELRLSPFSMFLLQRGVQSMVICAFALALILGGAWLLCSWYDWKDVDPVAMIWPSFKRSVWDPQVTDLRGGMGALYCLFLLAFFILGWFVRWRWLVTHEKKAITHRALRHWREITGCLFVLECWLFLTVLLALWPLRARLHHRLDAVAAKGETVLLANMPP